MKYLLSTDIVLITQLLRKQIDKGKTYYICTCRILGNYWISQGILAAVKCFQKEGEKEAHSSGLRVLFGKSSRRRYTKVDSPSGALRRLFDFSSRISRSTLEALSKPSRRIVGPFPNDSRRDLEALPKGSRAKVDRKLINGRRSSGVDTCLKRVWDFLIKALQESNTVCTQTVVSSQLIMLESTVGSSLSYLKYTAKILSKYLKNTRELLNEYLIAAKELLYVSRFLVNLSAEIGRVVEFYAKAGSLELVDRVNGLCLKFKGFQAFYRCRVCEEVDFIIQQESGAQNALKCSLSIFEYKRHFRLLLTCLVLVFHMFSLSAQTPRRDSGASEPINLTALKPGDKISDAVWDQAFELHYFNGKKKTIKFSDLKGKLILLDFWSTGCPSCIEGIPKMELIQEHFKDKLSIVLVNSKRNNDTPQRIKKVLDRYKEKYNYEIQLLTILDDTLLTGLFPHNTIPNITWINQDGVFLGNTLSKEVAVKHIESVLRDKTAELQLSGEFRNKADRLKTPPILDTTGVKFLSAITGYLPQYLPTYPNVIQKDRNSNYQMVNVGFSFMLDMAFAQQLKGFQINDYVFEDGLENNIKDKFKNSENQENQYSYQLFVNDTISRQRAEYYFQKAFKTYFHIAVERRKGPLSFYSVKIAEEIVKLKSKGNMRIANTNPEEGPIYFQNYPLEAVLNILHFYLDSPVSVEQIEKINIDLTFPIGFEKMPTGEKLTFLAGKGIHLRLLNEEKEYPYIYRIH